MLGGQPNQLWLLSGSPAFNCWIVFFFFFFSGSQFYVLLSPYLCFISFLYLDFNVLGNNSLISYRYVMQTKHLCILIHLRTKGKVGIVKHV